MLYFFLACETRTKRVIDESTLENLQPFKDKMTAFLDNAMKKLLSECDNLNECKEIFISTVKFYHYKPKAGGTLEDFPPNEFFDLWLPFCKDFKDIWKKELISMEKEKYVKDGFNYVNNYII